MYKFSLKEIADDPTVQFAFSRRSLRAETARNYLKCIRMFCHFFNAKPSVLVEQFRRLSPDEIVVKFGEFFAWAKDRVAPRSLWPALPGVKLWLVENGVRDVDRVSREIAREFKRKFGGLTKLLKRDVLTKEEITRLLKIANLREKAIICAMASGGFRMSACLNLQVRHFKDDIFDLEKTCYAVEIPEHLSKEGIPYISFISAEAADYIRSLLLMRKEQGEEIGPNSYIFVVKQGEKPLSAKRFENIWRELCERAGLDLKPVPIKGVHPVGKKGGGVEYRTGAVRYNTRIHALRKFFKTACSTSGVDRMASEAFLGHSLTAFGIESVYDFSVTNIEWLRNEYMKVLPNVTFLKPLPVLKVENHEARERISQLEEENRALKQQIAQIIEELKMLKLEVQEKFKLRRMEKPSEVHKHLPKEYVEEEG